MRPYRGLTKEGKLVKGDLINVDEKTYIATWIGDVVFYDTFDKNNPYYEKQTAIGNIIEVIPSTVGQSTGLKDKNGKESYKNDEIKFLTISGGIGKGIIEYEAPTYFVRMKTGARYDFSEFSEFEIIGTIHDKEQA